MDAVGRAFEGKRVFVTGHTGFKGSWLCEWLLLLGADVWGYALPPPTQPALFEQLGLAGRMHHRIGDVCEPAVLSSAIAECQPDFVFHLAAQPLVRFSYERPVETCATNVMGTVHVLSALRESRTPCAVVIVTSDKCYENREQGRVHSENDPLGGRDPYSASKAAAEILTAAWRDAFFSPAKILTRHAPPVAIATARAGNVVGGGDWAPDRILPDCLRALSEGKPVPVRHPNAIRPWQHVLEPLSGYLALAARLDAALKTETGKLAALCSPFNFGPRAEDHRPVRELVETVLKFWPGRWEDRADPAAVGEAQLLHLSTAKAQQLLDWNPRWHLTEAVRRTIEWHRSTEPARERTRRQIADYLAAATP